MAAVRPARREGATRPGPWLLGAGIVLAGVLGGRHATADDAAPRPSGRAAPAAAGWARVETLPAPPGVLVRLYQPEFRAAEGLLEDLRRFGLGAAEAGVVGPWTTELRPPEGAPPAPPGLAGLFWPRPRVESQASLADAWQGVTRGYAPVRTPTRLLLRGPPADVARLEQVLRRVDLPAPSVAVDLLVAEVRCVTIEQRGGHLLFSRDTAVGGPDTIFRGVDGTFEPDAWLRSQVTGVLPFQGTSLTFGRFEPLDGAFEHVLRALALRQEAELVAQPCLVCTESEPCGLEALAWVPAITARAGIPVPRLEAVAPLDTGVRLGLKAARIAADAAVLDVLIQVRTAEPSPAPDAVPGALALRTREFGTRVTAADGAGVVLGGITLSRRLGERRGMPWVERVPLLALLGSARGRDVERTELLFALRPRVLALGAPAFAAAPPAAAPPAPPTGVR